MNQTFELLKAVPPCPAAAEALRQAGEPLAGTRPMSTFQRLGLNPGNTQLPTNLKAFAKAGAKETACIASITSDTDLLGKFAQDSRTSVRLAVMGNPNATADMKQVALELALKSGSTKHRKDMALAAPAEVLVAATLDSLDDGNRMSDSAASALFRAMMAGDGSAVAELHAQGVNLDSVERSFFTYSRTADLDGGAAVAALDDLAGSCPDALYTHLFRTASRHLRFEDMSRTVFTEAIRTGALWEVAKKGHWNPDELLDWQRDLLLATDNARAHRIVATHSRITGEVLNTHGDKVYQGTSMAGSLNKWSKTAVEMLVNDAQHNPTAGKALAAAVRIEGPGSYLTTQLKHLPVSVALDLINSSDSAYTYRFFIFDDAMTYPAVPAADILNAKNPEAAALLLVRLDPRDQAWTLEECEKLLAREDLRPPTKDCRDTAQMKYLELRLGDDTAAWKMLFSLVDDWEGSCAELADTALTLAGAQ